MLQLLQSRGPFAPRKLMIDDNLSRWNALCFRLMHDRFMRGVQLVIVPFGNIQLILCLGDEVLAGLAHHQQRCHNAQVAKLGLSQLATAVYFFSFWSLSPRLAFADFSRVVQPAVFRVHLYQLITLRMVFFRSGFNIFT